MLELVKNSPPYNEATHAIEANRLAVLAVIDPQIVMGLVCMSLRDYSIQLGMIQYLLAHTQLMTAYMIRLTELRGKI